MDIKFTPLIALSAAFLATGCQQVCKTYGNKTTCQWERIPTEAERKRDVDHAVRTLDWLNCVERGAGTREQCRANPSRKGESKPHQLLPRATGTPE